MQSGFRLKKGIKISMRTEKIIGFWLNFIYRNSPDFSREVNMLGIFLKYTQLLTTVSSWYNKIFKNSEVLQSQHTKPMFCLHALSVQIGHYKVLFLARICLNKQKADATSTAEVEYVALTEATNWALYLRAWLNESIQILIVGSKTQKKVVIA